MDVDVELAEDGKTPANDFKFRAQLPTIEWLAEHGAKTVLAGHFGRPEGKCDMRYSLAPMAKTFSVLLGARVRFLDDCVGDETEDEVLNLKNREIILLENLRFHKEETDNDPVFAKKLARLADLYVNNAFASSHRAHASIVGVPRLLPSYSGLLLEKEVQELSAVLQNPKKPLVLLIGGAKIETKLPVVKKFVRCASAVLVGGATANTFLAAKGYNTEASKIEKEFVPAAKRMLRYKNILLPTDAVTSPNPHGRKAVAFRDIAKLQSGEMVLDIGPRTTERFAAAIRKAGTIVWNGPVGLFEIPAFAHGTEAMARAIAKSRAYKVVGGGETGIMLKNLGLESAMDHISTGGGAMLEFLGIGRAHV